MKIVESPSPNYGPRAAGKKVSLLILHYTDTLSVRETLDILQSKERQVSAHYALDEDGTAYRLVDEDKRAWHAGKSFWEGEEDVNSVSVGIEIQNPGHVHGLRPFPPAQVEALVELCRGIVSRHGIAPPGVIAHSDIAPLRKKDPGELFPWRELAAQGIGLWPHVTEEDRRGQTSDLTDLMIQYGYDPRVDLTMLTIAFQRHFQPELFKTPEKVGMPDLNGVYIMNALLRQKKALLT